MHSLGDKPISKRYLALALGLCMTTCCQATVAAGQSWELLVKEGDRRFALPDFPGAESCFRQALREVKKNAHTSDDVVTCMQRLASVLQAEDLTETALPLYKKTLKIQERNHGKDSQQVMKTLLIIAAIYDQDGDYRHARDYYEQALAIATKDPGPQSILFADTQHKLGKVQFKLGLPQQAEPLYESALQILLTQSELPTVTTLQNLLADYLDFLWKSNRPEKIASASNVQKELLKDQVEALKQTQGVPPSKWSTAVSGRLGTTPAGADIKDGRIVPPPSTPPQNAAEIVPNRPPADFAAMENIKKQRVDFYERMIAVDVDSLGPDHPSVARDLGGLAAVHMQQKQYEKARPLLERALQIYKTNYGDDAMLVKRTQGLLEIIAQEMNPPLQGSVSLDDYVAGLPRIPVQAQTLETSIRLNDLAFGLYSRGSMDEALKAYGWALAATARATGQQSSLVAACLKDYARVLRNAGKTADADRYEMNAQAIVRKELSNRAAIQ